MPETSFIDRVQIRLSIARKFIERVRGRFGAVITYRSVTIQSLELGWPSQAPEGGRHCRGLGPGRDKGRARQGHILGKAGRALPSTSFVFIPEIKVYGKNDLYHWLSGNCQSQQQDLSPHTMRLTTSQRSKTTSVGMFGKEPLFTAGVNVIDWFSLLGK